MKIKPIGSNMTEELETAGGDFVLFSYGTPVAARTATEATVGHFEIGPLHINLEKGFE